MNYHTLAELNLPHNDAARQVIIGFDEDRTFVELLFYDGAEIIGQLRWEYANNDELIERRFARYYIEICRQIPPYCARDIRTLYAAICLVVD